MHNNSKIQTYLKTQILAEKQEAQYTEYKYKGKRDR
jgi:hypothetical protein